MMPASIAPVWNQPRLWHRVSGVGSVSERPKVQHSKCCVQRTCTVGSNPTATATNKRVPEQKFWNPLGFKLRLVDGPVYLSSGWRCCRAFPAT